MSETTILNYPPTYGRTNAAPSVEPLFMPVKAPATVGETAEYKIVFAGPLATYGLHWNPSDSRKRAACECEVCPHCAAGKVPEAYHAAVVLDRTEHRYVIAQFSSALICQVDLAMHDYLAWLCREEGVEHYDLLSLAEPWRPEFVIRATRTLAGPRYQVDASPVRWDGRHDAIDQVSQAQYVQTPPGRRWSSLVEAKTAGPLRRAMPGLAAFDVMPFIFPELYTAPSTFGDDVDD